MNKTSTVVSLILAALCILIVVTMVTSIIGMAAVNKMTRVEEPPPGLLKFKVPRVEVQRDTSYVGPGGNRYVVRGSIPRDEFLAKLGRNIFLDLVRDPPGAFFHERGLPLFDQLRVYPDGTVEVVNINEERFHRAMGFQWFAQELF